MLRLMINAIKDAGSLLEPEDRSKAVAWFWYGMVTFALAWSFGLLEDFRLGAGFLPRSEAAEIEERMRALENSTDKKIERALAPIEAAIKRLEAKQERTERTVSVSARLQLESRIRDLKEEWCTTTERRTRDRLAREIAELKADRDELAAANTANYQVPLCTEVLGG